VTLRPILNQKSSSALVGYAAIDAAPSWLIPFADYMSCDVSGNGVGNTALDLFGLNNYEWCGDSTFEASYSGIQTNFLPYNIPAYFSEFGCITSPPRLWTETGALFSSDMSPVWSGGLAFSYFPATSAQGQFGMVTISSDGQTVTTSADFTRLSTQYAAVSPPDTPDQSTAGSTVYPTCPAQSSNLLASTTLPPTPNDAACNCLEGILSCRFRPQTSNTTAIIGQLLDVGCSLLGQQGGSCADIGGDGSTGVYGRVSTCSPEIKLSFVMSAYYEANSRNAQACSFAGNGTVNSAAPTSVAAANAAASSCLSNPGATFTPTGAGAGAGAGGAGATSTSSSTGNGKSGAPPLFGEKNSLIAVGTMLLVCIGTGFWTLA